MKVILIGAACAILIGCSGSPGNADATVKPTPAVASATPPASGSCTIPPKTYADLAACRGESEQISLEVADSVQGKTVGRIAIASRDPAEILAAMGDYTRQWSTRADSFTVFAYAKAADYAEGAGYNRGRIFWNNGGPITVNICTAFMDLGDGMDFCEAEAEYTVANE